MSTVIRISDAADSRLADYVGLTDVHLRRSLEASHGLFIAEGEKVIRRAIGAGYPVRSLLVAADKLATIEDVAAQGAAPVYVLPAAVVQELTGYRVHRGALAAMQRRPLPSVPAVLAPARRIIVLEDLVDHGNVGAIFRCAAALGLDAVILSPRCADPLYRRAVKVSMGAVLTSAIYSYAKSRESRGCYLLPRQPGPYGRRPVCRRPGRRLPQVRRQQRPRRQLSIH